MSDENRCPICGLRRGLGGIIQLVNPPPGSTALTIRASITTSDGTAALCLGHGYVILPEQPERVEVPQVFHDAFEGML